MRYARQCQCQYGKLPSELENRQPANVDDGGKVDLCSIEQDRQGEWRYLQYKVSHY